MDNETLTHILNSTEDFKIMQLTLQSFRITNIEITGGMVSAVRTQARLCDDNFEVEVWDWDSIKEKNRTDEALESLGQFASKSELLPVAYSDCEFMYEKESA